MDSIGLQAIMRLKMENKYMNKAVLVFDMPSSCIECPCLHINTFSKICGAMDEYIELDKPDWCPLREMPNKFDLLDDDDYFNNGWSRGYNYCINRILDMF